MITTEFKFNSIYSADHGYYCAVSNGLMGLFDKNLNQVLPFNFGRVEVVRHCDEDLFVCKGDRTVEIYDKQRQLVWKTEGCNYFESATDQDGYLMAYYSQRDFNYIPLGFVRGMDGRWEGVSLSKNTFKSIVLSGGRFFCEVCNQDSGLCKSVMADRLFNTLMETAENQYKTRLNKHIGLVVENIDKDTKGTKGTKDIKGFFSLKTASWTDVSKLEAPDKYPMPLYLKSNSGYSGWYLFQDRSETKMSLPVTGDSILWAFRKQWVMGTAIGAEPGDEFCHCLGNLETGEWLHDIKIEKFVGSDFLTFAEKGDQYKTSLLLL